MSLQINPFDASHLSVAGELLAARQQQIRTVYPALPERDVTAATAAVTTFFERPMVTGAIAFENDKAIAYLLAEQVTDMTWDRSVWIRIPGCVVAEGTDPEIIRDLYATVTARLVSEGCFNHYVVVPVADTALVQMFFTLSFGIEQMYALIDLYEHLCEAPVLPDGVTVRLANSEDREIVENFADIIWRHQVQAPVWTVRLPERVVQQRKSYGDMVDDKDAIVYLAFVDSKPAGIQAYFPPEEDAMDLLNHPTNLELSAGSTKEEFRGRGVATALTEYALFAAKEAGCRYVLTDWRSTNLLSSRFWPRRGFRPVAYRLSRRIDYRNAWGGLPTVGR